MRRKQPVRTRLRPDYKILLTPRHGRRVSLPRIRWPWFGLGLVVPLVAVSFTLSSHAERHPVPVVEMAVAGPISLDSPRVQLRLPLPAPENGALETTATQADEPAYDWTHIEVHRGDSLATLMQRHGVPSRDWLALSELPRHGRQFNRLHPGDTLRIAQDDNGHLQALYRPINEQNSLKVERTESGLEAELVTYELERRTYHATGEIRSSLFHAGRDAGLSDAMTMELAKIFAWDVDFAMDIRKGDTFTMIYEAFYRDGERVRTGNVLAAEFNNRGRHLRAVRFVDSDGNIDYYTPEGNSVRRAFLRTPVDFTRISSRFNPNRRHPVLNQIRAHRGVDYAAPRGTPIKAAGDGRVVHRGPRGGYGHTIIIEHAGRYTTLYAHMNGYARGIHQGSRVRQGQTIGYVGDSGLATGPHLHYEFRVDGVHKDPLKVDLPSAEPIQARYRNEFRLTAEPLLAQLDVVQRTRVASQQTP